MKQMIKNRQGLELAVVVEYEGSNMGLAFIVHGLGGFKEQVHIRAMAEAFLSKNYAVVTYDATNTIGESGGKMENATLTNYFEDLEDITNWAIKQTWYREPFIVAGHSLGGASSLMFAAKYPNKVKAIVPVSAFTGIDLQEGNWKKDPEVSEWQKRGYKLEESKGKPGVMKKIGWVFMEDALTHDMRTVASHIKCDALFITGSDDELCSPHYQQMVIDKLGGGKAELHVIQRMAHNPRSEEHNMQLKHLIEEWLERL